MSEPQSDFSSVSISCTLDFAPAASIIFIFLTIFPPMFNGMCKKLVTWSLTNRRLFHVTSLSCHGVGSNGWQQPVNFIGSVSFVIVCIHLNACLMHLLYPNETKNKKSGSRAG